MTKIEKIFYKHLTLIRRTTQVLAILFIIIVPIINKMGFWAVSGTFYSISVGNLDLMDPSLLFQYILLNKDIHFPLLLAGAIPLIIALLFGKVFCGWVCPFNLLAEYMDRLRRLVRPKSVSIKNKNPKAHYYWFVFGSIVTIIAISGIPVITFISFPGLISAHIADYVFWGTVGFELLLVLLVVLLEIFIAPRFWCKYACPVGATLALLRSKNTLSIKYDSQACSDNCPVNIKKVALCNAACPVNLNPRQDGIYPYCLNCGACIEACYTKGGQSITFTFHPQKSLNSASAKKINRNVR